MNLCATLLSLKSHQELPVTPAGFIGSYFRITPKPNKNYNVVGAQVKHMLSLIAQVVFFTVLYSKIPVDEYFHWPRVTRFSSRV